MSEPIKSVYMATELTDDELMERVARRDHSALAALLDRHGSSVYGYCMRTFSGNQAMVEDVAQEVWLKVVNHAARYKPEGHFKAWLMTVTRNCAISMIRKELPAHKREDAEEADVPADFDLEAEVLRKYDVSAIRGAVDDLVASQRTVLLLWLEEDASYETIAERLGMSYVSVRSVLCRAKENLRKRLEKKK